MSTTLLGMASPIAMGQQRNHLFGAGITPSDNAEYAKLSKDQQLHHFQGLDRDLWSPRDGIRFKRTPGEPVRRIEVPAT